MLTQPNYAGNIIINLASLPDFLRKPILKKRLLEFFFMSDQEKKEVIINALDAGPTIPFANFSKLFKTWLEALTTLTEEQRSELFFNYVIQIISSPEKLLNFNLDGILEIFISLKKEEKSILVKSITDILLNLPKNQRKVMLALIPDNAKIQLGV